MAIGIAASAILLVQILATRLLSATVSYHAAFAVLAIVMLALAAAASSVYRRRPVAGDPDPAAWALVASGPALAVAALGYIGIGAWSDSILAMAAFATASFYLCFYLLGFAVSHLLAAWSRDVARMYFADLLGAALGCLIAIPLVSWASPMRVLLVCGVVVSATGAAMAVRTRRVGAVAAVLLLGLVAVDIAVPTAFRIRVAKNSDQTKVLSEQWNQLARVTVSTDVPGAVAATKMMAGDEHYLRQLEDKWGSGWGVSDKWSGVAPESLWIELDADAGTPILKGSGTRPLSDFDVLRWDITSTAYTLRPQSLEKVFVIGGGGGRDFVTALHFGAKRVDVVELNPAVVEAVQERFGEFSGRPYTREGVHLTMGEARSELSRSTERYDVIEMSMIDTWAASMSGAMTLSENALYTREAFKAYVEHLDDDGILTVSRWYMPEAFGETARVVSLMRQALLDVGEDHPEKHVVVIYNPSSVWTTVATCLLSKRPLDDADIAALTSTAERAGYKVFWPVLPGVSEVPKMDVGAILRGDNGYLADSDFDLSPPTDDRPFFFNLRRPIHSWVSAYQTGDWARGSWPVAMFVAILGLIGVASAGVVFLPLRDYERALPASERFDRRGARPESIVVGAIGASFMAVELGLLQRYILFLGHPTYALTVVLFSLLVSTAAGSLLVGRWPNAVRVAFPVLLVGLLLTAFAVPTLLTAVWGASLAVRIGLAGLLVAPLGLCMGQAWPSVVSGMATSGKDRAVPWMWAINGVAGTFASVGGMFFAMNFGYTALLLLGAVGYAIAWGAFTRIRA